MRPTKLTKHRRIAKRLAKLLAIAGLLLAGACAECEESDSECRAETEQSESDVCGAVTYDLHAEIRSLKGQIYQLEGQVGTLQAQLASQRR